MQELKPVIDAEWLETGIDEESDDSYGECSNCHEIFYVNEGAIRDTFRYCPFCGARMYRPKKANESFLYTLKCKES